MYLAPCFLLYLTVDPCTYYPCQNGATCTVTGLDTYSCQCPDGSEGDNCETSVEKSKISRLKRVAMVFLTVSILTAKRRALIARLVLFLLGNDI